MAGVHRRWLQAARGRFESVLAGYYEGRKLMFASKVRAGLPGKASAARPQDKHQQDGEYEGGDD